VEEPSASKKQRGSSSASVEFLKTPKDKAGGKLKGAKGKATPVRFEPTPTGKSGKNGKGTSKPKKGGKGVDEESTGLLGVPTPGRRKGGSQQVAFAPPSKSQMCVDTKKQEGVGASVGRI